MIEVEPVPTIDSATEVDPEPDEATTELVVDESEVDEFEVDEETADTEMVDETAADTEMVDEMAADEAISDLELEAPEGVEMGDGSDEVEHEAVADPDEPAMAIDDAADAVGESVDADAWLAELGDELPPESTPPADADAQSQPIDADADLDAGSEPDVERVLDDDEVEPVMSADEENDEPSAPRPFVISTLAVATPTESVDTEPIAIIRTGFDADVDQVEPMAEEPDVVDDSGMADEADLSDEAELGEADEDVDDSDDVADSDDEVVPNDAADPIADLEVGLTAAEPDGLRVLEDDVRNDVQEEVRPSAVTSNGVLAETAGLPHALAESEDSTPEDSTPEDGTPEGVDSEETEPEDVTLDIQAHGDDEAADRPGREAFGVAAGTDDEGVVETNGHVGPADDDGPLGEPGEAVAVDEEEAADDADPVDRDAFDSHGTDEVSPAPADVAFGNGATPVEADQHDSTVIDLDAAELGPSQSFNGDHVRDEDNTEEDDTGEGDDTEEDEVIDLTEPVDTADSNRFTIPSPPVVMVPPPSSPPSSPPSDEADPLRLAALTHTDAETVTDPEAESVENGAAAATENEVELEHDNDNDNDDVELDDESVVEESEPVGTIVTEEEAATLPTLEQLRVMSAELDEIDAMLERLDEEGVEGLFEPDEPALPLLPGPHSA